MATDTQAYIGNLSDGVVGNILFSLEFISDINFDAAATQHITGNMSKKQDLVIIVVGPKQVSESSLLEREQNSSELDVLKGVAFNFFDHILTIVVELPL